MSKERGKESIRGQPPFCTASHRERIKERYKEIEKDKSQEAEDRWKNLNKKNWLETSQTKVGHS